MIRNWLLRKLGASWFVQTAAITTTGFGRGEGDPLAEERILQKNLAIRKLVRDLEYYGKLKWIEVPRPGGAVFILKLRVV